jgi:hypothetical protein
MKRTRRRIGLSASLAATMALTGAGPALAGHVPGHPAKRGGQGPKLITGNPGKGATVIHCHRLGGKSVLVITPSGQVRGGCRGVTAPLPRAVFEALPENVRELLPPFLVPPVE